VLRAARAGVESQSQDGDPSQEAPKRAGLVCYSGLDSSQKPAGMAAAWADKLDASQKLG